MKEYKQILKENLKQARQSDLKVDDDGTIHGTGNPHHVKGKYYLKGKPHGHG